MIYINSKTAQKTASRQPRPQGAFPWLWRWGSTTCPTRLTSKAWEKCPGDEVETTQIICNFILESLVHKKWQTSAIIREISDSNLETRRCGPKSGVPKTDLEIDQNKVKR